MPIIHIENEQGLQSILNDNPHVVVDFFSTDCPPCEALAPLYERASDKYPEIKFVKIMRQNNRELAESFTVMSSPTVLFFRDRKMLDKRLSGRINETEINQAIQEILE